MKKKETIKLQATDTSSEVAAKTRELLSRRGIVSPDITKMVRAKVNRNTWVFAKDNESLNRSLKKLKTK